MYINDRQMVENRFNLIKVVLNLILNLLAKSGVCLKLLVVQFREELSLKSVQKEGFHCKSICRLFNEFFVVINL